MTTKYTYGGCREIRLATGSTSQDVLAACTSHKRLTHQHSDLYMWWSTHGDLPFEDDYYTGLYVNPWRMTFNTRLTIYGAPWILI